MAVLTWDNGTITHLVGPYAEPHEYEAIYGERRLQEQKIDPLIKTAETVGVRLVKIDWYEDSHTTVRYQTKGEHRSFKKSKHYPQEK